MHYFHGFQVAPPSIYYLIAHYLLFSKELIIVKTYIIRVGKKENLEKFKKKKKKHNKLI